MNNHWMFCQEEIVSCFSIAPLQGYYYDSEGQHIILHVDPGQTSSVLEKITQTYTKANLRSHLKFVEKLSDEKLQNGHLMNGCRIEVDGLDGQRRTGTLAGVFQDTQGQLYGISALHVFTVTTLT